MFYEFLTGMAKGLLSGAVPGMHINNIVGTINDPAGIVASYASFMIFSFVPPIYLYSMNIDIGVAMFPSQRMALQGRSREALLLSTSGALLSFMITALLLATHIVDPIFNLFSNEYIALAIILFIIAALFIKQKRLFYAIFIFLLTGLLGIASMKTQNALMPMLSGFFGLPALLQKGSEIELPESTSSRGRTALPFLLASFSGFVAASTKAVTPGAISILLYIWLRSDEERMLGMGALVGSNAIATIGNFYVTGALRSGPAAQLARIESFLPLSKALFFFLLSAVLSFILLLLFSRYLVKVYRAINNWKVIFIVLLLVLVFLFSGAGGIFLFFVSSTIGILTIKLRVRRINCMGCIMVPALTGFLY